MTSANLPERAASRDRPNRHDLALEFLNPSPRVWDRTKPKTFGSRFDPWTGAPSPGPVWS